ncbi:MAG: hypothetical protein B7X41_16570, partial [Microbacterium sp. 14-71-5]
MVGAIGPWNWPLMITIWQIGPSLRMGNTVVAKPSEYTPLSVLAMLSVMNEVLPADVLIGISGDREVGARIASHPDIDKIMFTGSTATGRKIIESSAGNLARLTLELGGNDAGIVLPGTDPAAIAEDLFWGAFINTGQTCAAMKRLYVHDSLYDQVVDALAGIAASVPIGNGLDENNVLGPLQNRQQFDIVSRLVEDAKARGARIVTGGEAAPELGELFYRPTIVADIDNDAALVQEEQFGPALPVIRYSDVDEAFALANAVDVGLGASVWSSDPEAAREAATRMQSGTVWINSHGGLHPMVPFGGVKSSGYGLEFGVAGLKSVAVPQEHAAGRRLHLPRGKVTGGSHALNAMIWVRCAAADFDGWESAGATGWGWAQVLPVYEAIENDLLPVTDDYPLVPIQQSIIDAAVQEGLAHNPDYNGGALDGVSQEQVTMRDGRRVNTWMAYVRPVE